MQVQLGLGSAGGSFSPLGTATPQPFLQGPKHPSDAAAESVARAQSMMMNTVQMTSTAQAMSMSPMARFAQYYQSSMGGIQGNYLNPYMAQAYAGISGGAFGGGGGYGGFAGGSGFMGGMMPNPAMMTQPGMGIYRPLLQTPMSMISPFPQMPLFRTPFTPMPQPGMFSTPLDRGYAMDLSTYQQRMGAALAAPGVAAHLGTSMGFAAAGAHFGGRFGPLGSLAGAALGFMGSEYMGFGQTAQNMVDFHNPFTRTALRGQQLMGMSPAFVTGGADLNPLTGRGFGRSGANRLAQMLEDTGNSHDFRQATRGMFSPADLTRITQVSGSEGLLTGAQAAPEIHQRVVGLAKSLTTFMKLAQEPNVVEALKTMGSMRRMGLNMGEILDSMVEARQYSRMAGTSVRGVMEMGGAPGAMTFQSMGLSAGLGMRVGMGALGMANAAVNAGAFSPQRLAMLGGVQGVAQREMESSAAFLRNPMISAAFGTLGAGVGGQFGVDTGALRGLVSGGLDANRLATMGSNNLLDAVRRGGIGAIGLAQVQGSELQDQIGRLLGPQGLQAAKFQSIMANARLMGLGQNQGGFATAALAMGMDEDTVRQLMSQGGSSGYWRNLRQQNMQERIGQRALATEQRDAITHRGAFGRGLAHAADTARGWFRGGMEWLDWNLTDAEGASAARDVGMVATRTPDALRFSSEAERRRARGLQFTGQFDAGNFGAGSNPIRDRMLGGNADVRALNARNRGDYGFVAGLRTLAGGAVSFASGGLINPLARNFENEDAASQSARDWNVFRNTSYDDVTSGALGAARGLGIDEGLFRRASAMAGGDVAERARSDRSIFTRSGGARGNAEIAAALRRRLQGLGVSGEFSDEQLLSASGLTRRSIQTVLGSDAAEIFGVEVLDLSEKGTEARRAKQKSTLQALFGDVGSEDTQRKTYDAVFGNEEDDDVAFAAALMHGGAEGLNAAQSLGLTDKQLRRAEGLAGNLDDSQRHMLSGVSKSFLRFSGGDARSAAKNFGEARNRLASFKQQEAIAAGVASLFPGQGGATKDIGAFLKSQSGAKLTPEQQAVVDAFNRDPNEAYSMLFNRGEGSPGTAGGAMGNEQLEMARQRINDAAQGELEKFLPDSAKVMNHATLRFEVAVEKLIKNIPGRNPVLPATVGNQ